MKKVFEMLFNGEFNAFERKVIHTDKSKARHRKIESERKSII